VINSSADQYSRPGGTELELELLATRSLQTLCRHDWPWVAQWVGPRWTVTMLDIANVQLVSEAPVLRVDIQE